MASRNSSREALSTAVSVLAFEDYTIAPSIAETVSALEFPSGSPVVDAGTASWPPEQSLPTTGHLRIGSGQHLQEEFWSLLFGLLFFVPRISQHPEELTGVLATIGVDSRFLRLVKGEVGPGTCALFLVASPSLCQSVLIALAELQPSLVSRDLTADQQKRLVALFSEN